MYLELTGAQACALAAPVTGAVRPPLRALGQLGRISSVVIAGGSSILPGCPASLLRSDQRLHGEGVSLDAERAGGAALLCHVSQRAKDRTRHV